MAMSKEVFNKSKPDIATVLALSTCSAGPCLSPVMPPNAGLIHQMTHNCSRSQRLHAHVTLACKSMLHHVACCLKRSTLQLLRRQFDPAIDPAEAGVHDIFTIVQQQGLVMMTMRMYN
jgi:hypothetical protein